MIPLVAYARELELARDARRAASAAEEGCPREGFELGTMIELPRACFARGRDRGHADFFSFGTNDLTQTALGFSRDDIEGRIVPLYVDDGIVDRSPFETIDEEGVGELVSMAVERGRAARPGLELGVCGEHGGDPDSIRFFDGAGSTTSSCSPYPRPDRPCRGRAGGNRFEGVISIAGQATVLVLGGGFAGLETAFLLRMRLRDAVDLTLVSDRTHSSSARTRSTSRSALSRSRCSSTCTSRCGRRHIVFERGRRRGRPRRAA